MCVTGGMKESFIAMRSECGSGNGLRTRKCLVCLGVSDGLTRGGFLFGGDGEDENDRNGTGTRMA